MFTKIMVAFDNSRHAHKAFRIGLEIAKANNSQLHIVNVVHLPDYAGTIDEVDEAIEEGRKFYGEAIEKIIAEARKQGVKAYSEMLYGHIGQTLIKYANDKNIDMIITGSHGKSGVGKILLGSVSSFIAKHAKCHVLITREQ